MKSLSKEKILKYLEELSVEIGKEDLKGEILLFGGAAMVLAFNARPSTKDVDAIFQPKIKIYELSKRIAERHNLPEDWLNDSVKGFIRTDSFTYKLLVRFENLSVYVPEPEYLLAMKSISMRIGIESSDIDDVKYLIDYLELDTLDDIFDIIQKYYPKSQIPQKTYYAIEEIFQEILSGRDAG
ncbi:MAG: hypothetical protein KAW12_17045 [Candidatus Aminicenantes bacterium]|nr:hypothetical protein [Candidatus Aminicenantes bacterium]